MRTGLIDSFISKCIYNIMTSVRFVVSQNKSMSPSSKTKMTISNSINRPTITNSNSLLPADRFLFLYCRLSSFCWYLCSVQNCLVVSLNLLIFPIIILNDDYNDIYIYILSTSICKMNFKCPSRIVFQMNIRGRGPILVFF